MKKHYLVSTDKEKLDVEKIHDYISNRSYWAKGRSLADIKASIEGSVCFGIYQNEVQLGFARVITDKVVLAYLLDFFIFEPYQGRGLSKLLMEQILAHKELQTVFWLLSTGDAHSLYEQFGFRRVEGASRLMRRERQTKTS